MKISTTGSDAPAYRRAIRTAIVALIWLGVWQAAYMAVGQEVLVPSPAQTALRLFELMGTAEFWQTAGLSLFRIITGFALAVVSGTLLAVLMGFVPAARAFFSPPLNIIRATPITSFTILALVWIKSPGVPVFISFLFVLPIISGNVSAGIAGVDANLLEMARAFRFSRVKKLSKIYAPSVAPYFITACTTGLGFAWKAGVSAEVLGTLALSIGGKLYDAKVYLETADLFAWTAIVIVLSVTLEKAFGRLVRKYANAYRH